MNLQSSQNEQTIDAENKNQQTPRNGPTSYQIIIALLILTVAVLGFLVLQYSNTSSLYKAQLASSSNSASSQLSETQRILNLDKVSVLAYHTLASWPVTNLVMPLSKESACDCFRYSGYLSITWNTTANVRFEIIQFQLTLDTHDYKTVGDYKMAVSSADTLQMQFASDYCPSNGCGPITYTIVYHY
jgi:hypothetical protein